MGNYTSIEKEFNALFEPQINQLINTQGQNANPQAVQNSVNEIIQKTLLDMRIDKMKELCEVTHRNLICYFSAWLQSSVINPELQINDNDMNGLMNAVSGIEDCSIGLDIMLHTPGGVVTATESLVNYLRRCLIWISVL